MTRVLLPWYDSVRPRASRGSRDTGKTNANRAALRAQRPPLLRPGAGASRRETLGLSSRAALCVTRAPERAPSKWRARAGRCAANLAKDLPIMGNPAPEDPAPAQLRGARRWARIRRRLEGPDPRPIPMRAS